MKTVLPLLGEYLGTFLLVFVALTTANPLVLGGTLSVILFLVGGFSGGFVNPAITYASYLNSKLTFQEMSYYVLVQLFAALTSYSVYSWIA